MKLFYCLWLMLLSICGQAQTLNREYISGINFYTRKDAAIDAVIQKARNYITSDVDEIQKKLRKEKKIKLTAKNMESFLSGMENDLRTTLQQTDEWGDGNTYNKYGFYLSEVLGYDLTLPGLPVANTAGMGKGSVYISFKNNYPYHIGASMATTRDYTIYSGFPFTDAHLANVADIIRKDLGPFTFRQYTGYWNSCTSDNEPVYNVEYTIKNEGFTGIFFTEYGVYQRLTGAYKGDCRMDGNHLTKVSLDVTKNY